MFNTNVVVKNDIHQNQINSSLSLVARELMAYIFIIAGCGKVTAHQATSGYMESMGVSAGLLPITILVELGGGLALLLGFQARFAALGLAIFSLITGFIVHLGVDDAVNLMKNLAIAGGLLFLVLHGAGKLSLDHLIEK